MGHRKKHAPRHGSLAYAPRKRAASIKGRVRNWRDLNEEVNFLGFAGFKVGMTHITYIEDQENSPYYGKELMKPVTILEVPPLILIGIRVYNEDEYGKYVMGEIFAQDLDINLNRRINLPILENHDPKTKKENLVQLIDSQCEIHGIFQSQPYRTSLSRKKPDIFEIKINSTNDPLKEFEFAYNLLGDQIRARDVLIEGELLDVISVSKGKGFQGPVKRYGIKILTRKNNKIRRAVACIGPWHPARVLYTVPRPGQLGFHQRTEYHKRLMFIGENEEEINPKGGFINYGKVSNDYLLILGSIPGPKKRLIRIRKSIRPVSSFNITSPEITFINRESQQRK
ncbi:MAG: 50S ribosomal protein L3 [Candidatus Lokiarchaeota archaeon]|nr:50S ribosomal protein L3 [Candidatus Lokiarchaeota archaeon]MBD3198590.1 50S ribosomal protein L3 [Candidatus Lokiarchaeota archaeon]